MGMLALCEQQSVLLPDETVAVSENTRKYVKGIRHVIPCGVDTSRFRPGGRRAERPTVLFVGTMHGRKRGRWLVEVFEREVRSRLPEAELWCVCDKPADMPVAPAGVTFHGRVSEDALTDLYRRAWVFCLPSTYEGFGVPYIEAMASGLPVVTTANPGSLEVTRDGQDGRVVADERLGEELVRVLTEQEAREAMTRRGIERSMEFSWERVCERYEQLYTASAKVAAA